MARGDYYICPVCDNKALYDGSAYDRPDITVFHDDCLDEFKRGTAAEAHRAAADSFTSEVAGIRQSAGQFIGDDLLAYVQGIEYAVDRLRATNTAKEDQ